jgi:hypothetical protein
VSTPLARGERILDQQSAKAMCSGGGVLLRDTEVQFLEKGVSAFG